MLENGQRFLILDDELSIRQSIAAYMEDEGHVVHTAETSEDALNIIRQQPIDGVVVDIRLPGEDGNAFMVKAGKLQPGIRFVVHTGSADYAPPAPIRALGVTPERIIIKPAPDLDLLIRALCA